MLTCHFQDVDTVISKLLAGAQQEVMVAVAWLTHPMLIEKLAECAKRGCRVVVIINDDRINRDHCPIEYLKNSNVQIVFHQKMDDSTPIMHHKFCVIDEHTVITGSFNWTKKASLNNENIVVLQNDRAFARSFLDVFEQLAQNLGVDLGRNVIRSPMYGFYKQQIELLEAEIAALQAAIEQAQNLKHRFEQTYWSKLGHLLRDIAQCEAEIAECQAQRIRKESAKKAAEEARKRFEQYSAQTEAAQPPRPELSEEAAQSLRELFWKIAKKIHPDRYASDPEKYEQANRLMAEANAAYQLQDKERLQKLLDLLESGMVFESDALPDDLERLQKVVDTLIRRRNELAQQLAQIQSDEVYISAQTPDWETFFANETIKQEAKLQSLRNELQSLRKKMNNEQQNQQNRAV